MYSLKWLKCFYDDSFKHEDVILLLPTEQEKLCVHSLVASYMIMVTLSHLKPLNINWQDCKYTLFVIFICHSQKIRCTVQWAETNLVRTSSKTLDWNSPFKVEFQSTCIYAMNREKFCKINFLNTIQIDTRHQIQYWRIYMLNLFNNKICIIDVKVNGLKINLNIGIHPMFLTKSATSSSLCIALWSRMFWL